MFLPLAINSIWKEDGIVHVVDIRTTVVLIAPCIDRKHALQLSVAKVKPRSAGSFDGIAVITQNVLCAAVLMWEPLNDVWITLLR